MVPRIRAAAHKTLPQHLQCNRSILKQQEKKQAGFQNRLRIGESAVLSIIWVCVTRAMGQYASLKEDRVPGICQAAKCYCCDKRTRMIGVTCCSPAHIGLSRIGRNSLTKLCSSLLGGSSLSFCSLTDDTQCAGHHGVGKKCAKYISCVARTQCLVFQYQKGT